MPLLLAEADVRSLLTMDDLIETMGLALADFSAVGSPGTELEFAL